MPSLTSRAPAANGFASARPAGIKNPAPHNFSRQRHPAKGSSWQPMPFGSRIQLSWKKQTACDKKKKADSKASRGSLHWVSECQAAVPLHGGREQGKVHPARAEGQLTCRKSSPRCWAERAQYQRRESSAATPAGHLRGSHMGDALWRAPGFVQRETEARRPLNAPSGAAARTGRLQGRGRKLVLLKGQAPRGRHDQETCVTL